MEEKENLQELKIATLNSEQLQQKIDQESISWCEELIKDLEKFRDENKTWSQIWFSIYIIFGLIAVIFSSISAILTFSDFTNKFVPFSITFLSTVSAYILTFLNPSGREEKRRQCVKRSSALLEKVKTTKRLIGLKTEADILDKLSSFSDQFASLIEDSLN